MTSVALTFIFYWLFLILVLILFLIGGVIETEVCRHALNYNDERSADVLAIVDTWANDSLYSAAGLEIPVFHAYA